MRARAGPALLVLGLFSGLVLKGVSHLLIALDVPGANDFLPVAHVMIVVFAIPTLALVAYNSSVPLVRRRRAERAVETAATAGDRDGAGAPKRTVEPLVGSGVVPGAACAVLADGERSIRCFGRFGNAAHDKFMDAAGFKLLEELPHGG